MKHRQNLWLLLGVLLLTVLPLALVPFFSSKTGDDHLFGGADEKAMRVIDKIAPDYRPWFHPLIEPMSGEISSLLFSLQAALGAGVIGYYFGAARTRERLRVERDAVGTEGKDRLPENRDASCAEEEAGSRPC